LIVVALGYNPNHIFMRIVVSVVVAVFLFNSCIPLRIAPDIDDYKITKGKSFKKGLPKREMFVFEDPKEADEFYDYVNIKFQLNNENVYDDVPFEINTQTYFFSFYEVEIPDKTINLFPVVLDVFVNAALGNEDVEPIFSDDKNGVTRNGHWYIAIEAYSDHEKDCLKVGSLSREVVLNYLRALKKEYISTHNYNETVFKN
tara:strand:+ start:196 stop:798 length:603 start_codon:yes stop_codon:yes gene_type:complete